MGQSEKKEKVIQEIFRLSKENNVPCIIFENEECAKQMLKEMRLGHRIKRELDAVGAPMPEDVLM